MVTITYKTKTSPICHFSSMGTLDEAKSKLAFIMGDDWYEIISTEEAQNVS